MKGACAVSSPLSLQPGALLLCADVLGNWRPTMYVVSALLLPSAILYFVGAYAKGKDFRAEQPPGEEDGEKLSPSGGVAFVPDTPVVYCSWHLPSARLACQFHHAVWCPSCAGPIHAVKSGSGQLIA